MEKYITDAIHNSLRAITEGMTRPQQKAVAEIVRGLFTAGEPILTHLAQNPAVSAKKQAEKYSYHLGNIELTQQVEDLTLRKVTSTMRKEYHHRVRLHRHCQERSGKDGESFGHLGWE